MQVTETLSEGLRRSYAVCVPAADIESRAKARLQEVGKNLRLPGFRPGKVPANLVRQRYGSSVMAEVLQDAVNGAADQVVAERQLRTAGRPRVSLDGQPDLNAEKPQDLNIKVELELLPEIAIPELTALSLTRVKSVPADDVVAKALDTLAQNNRALQDIDEVRQAVNGDVLVIDFKGFIDGVPFAGGEGQDAPVELGGSGFIPGFAEQLEGMTPGDSKTIAVTFPEAYPAAEVAGKPAAFEITAKKLQKLVTPEQDDTLASKVGVENYEKLKELVTAQIQGEYDQLARLKIKRELLDALAEKSEFASPETLLEAEFGAIWQRVEADRREGREDDEDKGKDEATLREEYRAIADRRVRLGLLLSEIARTQNIQVTQPELTQALRREAARYPGQEQQVVQFFQQNPGAVEQLRGPILEDKVVDYILSVAQVAEKIVPPEELQMPGLDRPPMAVDAAAVVGAAGTAESAAEAAAS